jgi:hypothetical protein
MGTCSILVKYLCSTVLDHSLTWDPLLKKGRFKCCLETISARQLNHLGYINVDVDML